VLVSKNLSPWKRLFITQRRVGLHVNVSVNSFPSNGSTCHINHSGQELTDLRIASRHVSTVSLEWQTSGYKSLETANNCRDSKAMCQRTIQAHMLSCVLGQNITMDLHPAFSNSNASQYDHVPWKSVPASAYRGHSYVIFVFWLVLSLSFQLLGPYLLMTVKR
jgi:hypothetical protein